ncbi:MAG: hypothetical protein AMJ79_06270 [Phycisphaerae bacterium SM23_30]|nr:MAG: hypothetical protein AMJ79_06270 [Phycisphaerae bacterium SM23_30]
MAEQNNPIGMEQNPKHKLPLKTIIIILGVLLMEGSTIVAFKVFSKPSPAEGSSPIEGTAETPAKDEAEIALAEKFSVDNHMAGRTTLVVTMDVSIKVKKIKEDDVKTRVEANKAEILDSIRTLVASAQLDQLKEPDKQVIKREIKTAVEKIIGKELIETVLITDWKTYSSGYNS